MRIVHLKFNPPMSRCTTSAAISWFPLACRDDAAAPRMGWPSRNQRRGGVFVPRTRGIVRFRTSTTEEQAMAETKRESARQGRRAADETADAAAETASDAAE